ncbi:uncharacterized protein EV154DRAFT_477653 [Mucor mucedo]|uniref:uncharacterized protein n=1 Tax=Mucor mucedo TaxID=29922 RepID=UPI0022211542|nr:uncharacterized protein EV154DRAFT_477653 [Mucor mucedo]KAI7895211.1 hypothetical protein EV154DRAFT_477653 [Mucor mucedo]
MAFKVYASPCCKATSTIVRKDSESNPTITQLKNVYGDVQDLLEVFSKSNIMIRLRVVDFADLIESPSKQFKLNRIHEVVFDNEGSLEIITSHEIINEDKSTPFKCRKRAVKGSA